MGPMKDKRDEREDGYYPGGTSWWWTADGQAARYAIAASILAVLLLYFVGGYYHAKARMSKNLPPLSYHRWMVRRSYHYRSHPHHAYAYRYPQNPPGQYQTYPMESYAPPPPAYNNADGPPPAYQPPAGGSKVVPDQGGFAGSSFAGGTGDAGVTAPPPVARQ